MFLRSAKPIFALRKNIAFYEVFSFSPPPAPAWPLLGPLPPHPPARETGDCAACGPRPSVIGPALNRGRLLRRRFPVKGRPYPGFQRDRMSCIPAFSYRLRKRPLICSVWLPRLGGAGGVQGTKHPFGGESNEGVSPSFEIHILGYRRRRYPNIWGGFFYHHICVILQLWVMLWRPKKTVWKSSKSLLIGCVKKSIE